MCLLLIMRQKDLILTFLFLIVIDNVIGTQVEHLWHSYEFGSKYGNREELVIRNITTDDGFKYGENVLKWKTINLLEKTYAFGLTKTGVTILVAEYNDTMRKFKIEHKKNELDKKLVDITLFKDFNIADKAEIIAIIPVNEKNKPSVSWYRVTDKLELKKIWELTFHFYIVHVNYMFIDDKHLLLLIDDEYRNSSLVEIYNFNLQTKEIAFQQLLQLSNTTECTHFVQFGVTHFLAFPQHLQKSILVYTYKGGQFAPFRNITGVTGTQIVSFKGGFNNYLAINGKNSDVFQISRFKLSIAKLSLPLTRVDYWLEIPARPYSDEPILFAQRLTNHSTHTSYAIDVMLYHNEKFILHEETNCTYFGEKSNGVNCIVEDEHSSGLRGAAVIGDGVHIGLLIPRKKGPSILVQVNYELKERPDIVDIEVEKLEITKELVEQDIDRYRRKKLAKGNSGRIRSANLNDNEFSSDDTDNAYRASQVSFQVKDLFIRNVNVALENINNELDELQTKINMIKNEEHKSPFDKLKVTGDVNVEKSTNVKRLYSVNVNDHSVKDVFNDTVNRLSSKRIKSRKEFDNVEINKLNVNTINGKEFADVAMKSQETLKFNGDVKFVKPVVVKGDVSVSSGLVNGLSIKDEIINSNTLNVMEALNFEDVEIVNEIKVGTLNNNHGSVTSDKVNALHFDRNINVKNINGNSLDDFLKRIVRKDIPTKIPGNITINGRVTSNKAYTTYLNGLKFDSEYLFKNPDTSTNISGRKTFTGTVTAKDISTSGLLNNINLNNVITLNNNQTMKGNFRFHDLEITERLDIDGTVSRSEMIKLKPKLAIYETDIITSDTNFRKLQVDGTVTISGDFNGKSFKELLNDVVYKDIDNQEIESVKQFNNGITIHDNLIIKSNSINNISIDSFVSKDTDQILNMTVLNGNVAIDNLELDGYLNGINITELDQETVKLTGEQYISATLNFNNNNIDVNDLNINQHLNGINVDYYVNNISNVMHYDKIHVEDLEVSGNFEALSSNFDSKQYKNRRLSKSENQTISVPFHIENSNINVLKADYINDFPYRSLFNWDLIHSLIYAKIVNGSMYMDTVVVNGSMHTSTINGMDVKSLWDVCAKEVIMSPTMKFKEDVYFDNSVSINQLCGIDFKEFTSNLVFKNETSVNLTMKEYLNGFEVDNIFTDHLNTVNKYDILTKTDKQTITAPITFTGNVIVPDEIDISESLNGMPMNYLNKTFQVLSDGYKVDDDLVFERLIYVDHLNINGLVNDKNLTDIMENLIFINDDMNIHTDVTFKGRVIVQGNLTVTSNVNDINFNQLIDDIAFINKFEYVDGFVKFNDPVNIRRLEVDNDLDSRFIMGIDLQKWKDNATFIDRGLISGNVQFEKAIASGLIRTKYLNNIDTNSFIPLRTNQNITQDISIETMSSIRNIHVTGLVNGYRLRKEYENTLMNEHNQFVNSPIEFNDNVIVRDFLTINNLVNGVNISKVVTTNTDQYLTADYEFTGESILNKDLNVRGLVNDINVTKWDQNAIKSNINKPINIDGVWSVENNVTFYGKVNGRRLINGINITEIAKISQEKRHFKNNIEQNLVENYNHMCKDIDYFMKIAKKQIYSYKYLDHFQEYNFDYKVETVHYFPYKNNHFVLVSGENNCTSTLLLWNNNKFITLKKIETGTIKQIITSKINEEVFLITISNPETKHCKIQGTYIWKINDFFNIEPYHKLETVYLLQDSIKSGTFYCTGNEYVMEYHINSTKESVIKYMKWLMHENISNMTFMPRGFETGLALRNSKKIIMLKEPLTLNESFNDDHETSLGYIISKNNYTLPGSYDGEIIPIEIGPNGTKTLAAVATNQDFKINQNSNSILIYEDIFRLKLLTKISSYKPSSLKTFHFDDNGETLLIFMEDNKMLQLYEYKGFEGFKHKQSTSLEATQLFTLKLPTDNFKQHKYILGTVNENKITLLEAVMDGHKIITNDLQCTL